MTSFWLRDSIYTEHLFLHPTRPGEEQWIIQSFTNPDVRRYLGGAFCEDEVRATIKITGEQWGYLLDISPTIYIHLFHVYM